MKTHRTVVASAVALAVLGVAAGCGSATPATGRDGKSPGAADSMRQVFQ